MEIDNYDDPCQIVIQENPEQSLRVTYKTPEELSELQEQHLIEQFTIMNQAIYSKDPTGEAFCQYIDVNSIARYFIVREILHDTDGYNGSFYLHKDLGEDSKWNFGPLWDLSFGGKKNDWIMYDHPGFSQIHWIEPIFHTDAFQSALYEQWNALMLKIDDIYPYINSLTERCEAADAANNKRWPDISNPDTKSKAGKLINEMKYNIQWINNKLSVSSADNPIAKPGNSNIRWFNMQGIEVADDDIISGVYIRVDQNGASKILRRRN